MPHFSVQIKRSLKAGTMFCLSWGSQMPSFMCDRDKKKLHKHQILSSLSLQALLSVGSSLPAVLAPGLWGVDVIMGGRWRIAMVG